MNKLFITSTILLSMLMPCAAQTETRQLSIDTKSLGIEISPTLSGIFFEDINQSLDGGICAQMIQNNSFQAYNVPDGPANEFSQSDTIFFGWTVVSREGAVGKARTVSDHPLIPKLERYYDYDPNDKYDDEQRYIQYCVRFDIEKAGAGFGIKTKCWLGKCLVQAVEDTWLVWWRMHRPLHWLILKLLD